MLEIFFLFSKNTSRCEPHTVTIKWMTIRSLEVKFMFRISISLNGCDHKNKVKYHQDFSCEQFFQQPSNVDVDFGCIKAIQEVKISSRNRIFRFWIMTMCVSTFSQSTSKRKIFLMKSRDATSHGCLQIFLR